MPRTLCLHPDHKTTVLQALKRNRFLTQGDLAAHLEVARSTVSKFMNGHPVYLSKFEEICDVLDLDPREIMNPEPQPQTPQRRNFSGFHAYDDCWVGRDAIAADLSHTLQGQCRLLLIVGLTGIGKTALAERIAIALQDDLTQWQRANFDYAIKTTDFASTAIRWLDSFGVQIPPAQTHPELLRETLLDYLCQQPVLLVIDSVEALLTESDPDQGAIFVDPHWRDFFLGFLASEDNPSKIILTSQELPHEITPHRYHTFWQRHVLTGLRPAEQRALFTATGFDAEDESLQRLGAAYQGHPLVLRVILGEIWETFGGDVAAYWGAIAPQIIHVETTLAQAQNDANDAIGSDDDWQLHRLTRQVRQAVNQERLEITLSRLQHQQRSAYWLLCAAAAYRIPVQPEGWLIQLKHLSRRLGSPCDRLHQEQALQTLEHRFLVETEIDEHHQRRFGLHHLVRSVALERYQQLVQSP
ncbi:helix-turn-helix domain-containing protein [Spirulina major]|uniref:helix-turn-helix domain-containing protein n=1 Tax=Spirulina major TaxID=270636 RepID=UPI000934E548|nr:helix-turn-helix domain-containing protein [Spirulina major]